MNDVAVTKTVGTFTVTVTRCGCGGLDPHASLSPAQPCPTPKSVELAVEQDIEQTVEGKLIVRRNADGNDATR